MQTRIYVVIQKGTIESRRLVEAASPAQAIRHCAKNVYSAHVAGQRDITALMTAGVAVEKASESEAAPAAAAETPVVQP